MDLKLNLRLILLYLSALNLVDSLKNDYINDCYFQSLSEIPGIDEITFICGESIRENTVFTQSNKLSCSNRFLVTTYMWPGTVDFEGCRFPQMKRNYFQLFKNMHTFNITNVELESMQVDIFREATNVTKLDISRNKLAEIPSHIFFNAKKLEIVDFSKNTIQRVDSMAFEGAIKLEILNLSHNLINELLDSRTLTLPALQTLDLSYNNLTKLNEHIFDKLTNLQQLNLSFNAIEYLDTKIFSCLISLKGLSLKRTNLTNIQLGTFSQQHNLVSLDLSENRLTKLDFKLFLPILHDLRSLHLGNNLLKNLIGFRNTLFPQLDSLEIHGNQFSCEYLAHFMEIVNWERIHLNSDVNVIDVHKSNIRGIGCDDGPVEEVSGIEEMVLEKIDETQIGQGYKITGAFEKISLSFICVALAIFLVLFGIVNLSQIKNQFTIEWKLCQRFRRHSSDGNIVDENTECVNHCRKCILKIQLNQILGIVHKLRHEFERD